MMKEPLNHGLEKFTESLSLMKKLKSYIKKKLRKKIKNYFEKKFFQLMNNSDFGKTMNKVRKHGDIKLVETEKRRNYFSQKIC